MRSVPSRTPAVDAAGPAHDPSDLTARARIRDAALARFASGGFRVLLRTLAADAGCVSAT